MLIDPLRTRAGGDPQRAAALKGWVREALELDAATTVLVTELRCREPGCPPLETVIAVLGAAGTHQHKLPKAMAEVTQEDIAAIARAEDLLADVRGALPRDEAETTP